MSEHRSDKPWWNDVVQIKRERYATRKAALSAEEHAIKHERPKYNVVHNSKYQSKSTGPTLRMPCRHCGKQVGTGGYVYCAGDPRKFRREYDKYMSEHSRNGLINGGAFIGAPSEPSWILTHSACDDDPADWYSIDAPRISTWRDVAHWSAHLSEKNWFADTDWAGFVYWLERHNGGI
jgi:hypothetical protein